MTVCIFAGHREVYQAGVEEKIEETVRQLLQTDQKFVFYTGGMGSFDDMCSSAVRAAKRHHSGLNILLSLVLPYMSNRLNSDKEYYRSQYDEVIIPAELADVHYSAAIKMRNRWMVDQAAHIIAYVHRDFGGAHDTMKYARRKGKYVINLAENIESHICFFTRYGYSKIKRIRRAIMNETYLDLAARLEDSFPDIENEIIVDLRENNGDYAALRGKLSDMENKHPFIGQALNGNGEIHLTAEEHYVLTEYLRLRFNLDDMEREALYFRGHTDAVAYLKKIKAI